MRGDWIQLGMVRALAVCAVAWCGVALGQFVDGVDAGPAGPALGDMRTQKYRVGVVVTAPATRCTGIYATMPVPTDWPEQKVRVLGEETSPEVRRLTYRPLGGGVKQMIVEIPELRAGRQAKAIVTFELERHALVAPSDTAGLRIPDKPDRELRGHLGPSPYIESRDPRIVRLAKETAAGLDGWAKVEALYDVVREKVEYRNGDLKGARRALADGWGDCEELTCLFIAVCRAQGIPARTVWVEGHCYPEFYLVDAADTGAWYPCQAAGTRAFGSMPDQLPILQKGDDFRDPDRPGKSLRYVSEFLRGASADGAPPRVVCLRVGASPTAPGSAAPLGLGPVRVPSLAIRAWMRKRREGLPVPMEPASMDRAGRMPERAIIERAQPGGRSKRSAELARATPTPPFQGRVSFCSRNE